MPKKPTRSGVSRATPSRNLSARGPKKYTEAQLGKMSNEELLSKGYIRIAGFSKADGTKVKAHVRKLRPREVVAKVIDDLSQGLLDTATYLTEATIGNLHGAITGDKESIGKIVDFTPVIGDAKAFKESIDAFNKGNIGEGALLGLAGTVGLVPVVGDVAAKPLKAAAKSMSKSEKAFRVSVKTADKGRDAAKVKSSALVKVETKIKANTGSLKGMATKLENKVITQETKRTVEKNIAKFTKSDDYGKLLKKDAAIDAGTLKSPLIKRPPIKTTNTQGFAIKATVRGLGNNLSLKQVKMDLRKQYAKQGKDVDVYFHQAPTPGLTKQSFKPGAHAETGQAGTYVHLGDDSFEALKGTYGANTHAVIVDRKAGALIHGKRSYPGGAGEFSEAFVKPNQIVEIKDVSKHLSKSPGPKIASVKTAKIAVAKKNLDRAKKAFANNPTSANRQALVQAGEGLRKVQ